MQLTDESTLRRFYGDVPAEHLDRFRGFLASHTMKYADIDGVEVPYYSVGQGERTLLSFCGGHSTPTTLWETIASYENDYRVVVIDISEFSTVAELIGGVHSILEARGDRASGAPGGLSRRPDLSDLPRARTRTE